MACLERLWEKRLKEEMLVVSEPPQFADGYGWENWRRVCRRVDVHERLSVAVVGSGPQLREL